MTIHRILRSAAGIPNQQRLTAAVLMMAVALAACGGGDSAQCGGFVEPTRVLTPTPTSLTLEIGANSQVTASLSGGCANDDRTVVWTSSDNAIATINAGGSVTAVAAGTATMTATAFGNQARTAIPVTVRARVTTTLDLRPDIDTLSPLGTRTLTATVRDQTGALLPSAPVVYRSLTPAQATVSVTGVVTAVAGGMASIEAATPRIGADSLRDTVRILIVPACSLVRPVQIGTTLSGSIDASTCQNLFGYRVANQYSLTATEQLYYSVRLVPTITTALVPLNISGSLYGLPAGDTAVTAFGVMRPGTFGFLVTAPSPTAGTYTVTTELNPDPRLSCVVTDVTTGVNFRTAITPTCITRDIRILPALGLAQQVRITATAPGFGVTIELRNNATGALIQRAQATTAGGTATISLTNTQIRFGLLRVIGGSSVNDLVTVAIAQ